MSPRTHIVGAGVAGLSAALSALSQGENVALYEASSQAGGRCKTLHPSDGFSHDNGTHVLFSANRCALHFLESIGARKRWVEPEPEGLPLYDAQTRKLSRIGLTPWSWLNSSRRPPGLHLDDLARITRLAFCTEDKSVAECIGHGPLLTNLIEPLTVAVLNTSVAEASSLRLARALRGLLSPGSGHLLVAESGLSADLIEPALRKLEGCGAQIHTGERLKAIRTRGDRVVGLVTSERIMMLGPDEKVILALPPWEIARLMPDLAVPDRFEPILNVHYRVEGTARPRFIGLLGTLAQWVLVRHDHVSVTISAAAHDIGRDNASIGAQVWREIVPALQALDLDVSPDHQPVARVVKEKRATIRQAVGEIPQPILRPFANLALAGDWIGDYPATIESAVMAGERAACLLRRPPLRHHPHFEPHSLHTERSA